MTRRRSSRFQILSLSLALLLTGLVACEKSAGESEAAEDQTQTPAEGAPAEGQTAAATGQPGAAPATPSKPADTGKMPAVVANVNGKEIKKDDLLKQADAMRTQMAVASQGRQVPSLDEGFYKQVLDGMVAQELLLQDAKRQGVAVSDEELKPQMATLRGRFPSQAEFDKALSEQGLTEKQLTERLRDEAVIQKYVGTKVFNQIAVTDQDARKFYDENQDKMQRPERVHARHILIKVEPGAAEADKQKAKEKAEGLLEQIKGGADFARLAAESSDDPGSKVRGGDLSWFSRGQMVGPFDKAVFALAKPNDLSGVVETQFGYHIIQLLEKQAASAVPFEEAKPQINQMLKQRQAGQRLESHVEGLKKQGKVEIFL